MSESLSIVIPAFNEGRRISRTLQALQDQLKTFADHGLPVAEVLVVNDGSKDDTETVVMSFKDRLPDLRVHSFAANQGKGAAVKAGCLMASSDWILIADADMSTPWSEAFSLRSSIGSSAMAMASRALPQSRILTHQPWYRELMGRIFNFVLRLIVGLPFRDTQCGFKLLHRSQTRSSIEKLTIPRFAWDVELILLLLHEKREVQEVAATWEHQDESRVHPIKDSLNMLWTVVRVRLRLLLRG